MTELDKDLAELFSQDEPTPDREAFVASVHARVAWRRSGTRTIAFCLVAGVAIAAGAVAVLAPETLLYPAQVTQRVLASPLGASACALCAIGLSWWTRYGDA
jgi:hypothetical protein